MKSHLIYSKDNSLTISDFSSSIGYCIKVNSNGGVGGGCRKVYTKDIVEVLKGSVVFIVGVDCKGDNFMLNSLWVSEIEEGVILSSLKNSVAYFVNSSLVSSISFTNNITSSYLLKDITSVF